eukprot:TRINITY_DN7717_c0_g5_i1.p1 TRINITY_DN7717_c0_g5~~TRINITY_DN7717_c0_g5_i1.p1  ORF type:complete len:503 (-),score=133.98 TRINITY_DN7717_c0_g5_i1:187-1695(-)
MGGSNSRGKNKDTSGGQGSPTGAGAGTPTSPGASSGDDASLEIFALRRELLAADEPQFRLHCKADVSRMSADERRREAARLQKLYEEHNAKAKAQEAQYFSKSKLRSASSLVVQEAPYKKAAAPVARGPAGADNNAVEGILVDQCALLGEDEDLGLRWDRRWAGKPSGPASEDHRRQIRLGTRTKVAKELGIQQFGQAAANIPPQYCKNTTLFVDSSPPACIGSAPAGGPNLLGRFDSVCVWAHADFDKDWRYIKGKTKCFAVLHAAAVNIGESSRAADFPDFSRGSELDEDAYVEAMAHIYVNIARACRAIQAGHLLLFPFGMGAFLRHLRLLDRRFEDDVKMQELRRRLASRWVAVLAEKASPTLELHLCLQFADLEAQRNADAFLRAFAAAPAALRKRVTVYPEGDVLQLAHNLAQSSRTHVCLLNGANRQLLGNHWFAGHAKRAIDENLHRRSWTLSALSYLLNAFGTRGEMDNGPPLRDKDELRRNVTAMGGVVSQL